MGKLPLNYINRFKRDDPLENPRMTYWCHYDDSTLAGKWGEFLAWLLGIQYDGRNNWRS